jgi:alkylation response protein AidB-like acyl-CoA dehydrogenase
MASNDVNRSATEPSVYDHLKEKWAALPTNETEWVQRALDVGEILAVDVVQRDRENKSPRAEVALLKHSGLLKVLGPKKYGGGGQPWAVGYKLIREVAKVDGHDPISIQNFDRLY